MQLPPLPTLRELLKLLNFKACGQLSQNFLLQPWTIKGLVGCAGSLQNSYVMEVGPGPGGLTRAMLEQNPYHISVVELDRRFLMWLEHLKETAESMNIIMDIYNQDILKFNVDKIFPLFKDQVHPSQAWKPTDVGKIESENRRCHIVGNLPFNISTPLLSQWLHDISEKRGLWTYARVPLTVTFQREVGLRMTAGVCDQMRSRYSILCQSLCETKIRRIIPGSAFLPKAEVDCAVVHMVPRIEPLIPVSYPFLEKIVKTVFQFKNKSIVWGLEALFPPEKCEMVLRIFAATGINPEKSAIELSIDEFGYLAQEYSNICKEDPQIFPYNFRSRTSDTSYKQRKKMQSVMLDGQRINVQTVKNFVGSVYNKKD